MCHTGTGADEEQRPSDLGGAGAGWESHPGPKGHILLRALFTETPGTRKGVQTAKTQPGPARGLTQKFYRRVAAPVPVNRPWLLSLYDAEAG